MRIEAGGAFYDIDNDNDLDLVFGGDGSSNQIWWWENPLPDGDVTAPWTRRLIKDSGNNRHHDLIFADIDGDGADELVFWNQAANALFTTEIPANPRQAEPWLDMDTGDNVYTITTVPSPKYEGLALGDINQDGKIDLVGGGYWFEHISDHNFTAHPIAPAEWIRVAVGQLIPGGKPEVIQSPGEEAGTAKWYEWNGSSWIGHDLDEVINAHSLEVGDVNADGSLDIFIAEMAFEETDTANHNPNARTLVFLGDGQGNFTETVVATGFGQHESRIADLDGDDDLDILGKPYSWDTPRLDIWLNDGPGNGSGGEVCESLDDWNRYVIGDSGTHRNVFVSSGRLGWR
ncbi:MAG: VCBS repeat-containing protein [Chloroflexota bacterium]